MCSRVVPHALALWHCGKLQIIPVCSVPVPPRRSLFHDLPITVKNRCHTSSKKSHQPSVVFYFKTLDLQNRWSKYCFSTEEGTAHGSFPLALLPARQVAVQDARSFPRRWMLGSWKQSCPEESQALENKFPPFGLGSFQSLANPFHRRLWTGGVQGCLFRIL